MSSGINLGSIVEVGGKKVGSGISSGLDSATIIDGLTAARRIPADELEETIELNATKISAYNELRSLLENFRTAADFLRNPPGINNQAANIFEYRLASSSSNTAINASSYIDVTVAAGATLGKYDISIGAIAEAKQLRSQLFTTQNTSVTEAALGATSGQFSAGTYQYTTTLNTVIGDNLASADYTVTGSGSGIITGTGISNFIAPSTGGSTDLQGTISGFSAIAKATDLVDITVTIGTTIFTASNIDASTSGTDIASGTTLAFTDGAGTSFDLVLASNVTIDQGGGGEAANLTTFAANLTSGISSQSVSQTRELGNFTNPNNGILKGLERNDVVFASNAFNTDGTGGSFGEFTVTKSTVPGADDGIISIVIDGETYQATDLGQATVGTLSGDTLAASATVVTGAGTGILNATGIFNIRSINPEDANLSGVVSGFAATIDGTNVDLSVTINGSVYNAADVPANTGAGTDSIAAGVITFTNATTGTSFNVDLASEYVIGGVQGNADVFATALDTAVSAQTLTAATSEFTTAGTLGNTLLTTDGLHSFVTTGTGDVNLQGNFASLGGFVATYNGGVPTVDLSIAIGTSTYTATGISTSGGNVAVGTEITFTDGANTSFSITTNEIFAVTDAGTANSFATALDTALDPINLYQSRKLSNYDPSIASGLTNQHVILTSDAFNVTTGDVGALSGFTVTEVTGVGNSDGQISVVINGETYLANTMGNGSDIQTGNITLVNQTDNNETLQLNIGDAGATMDFSNPASAQAIADNLNSLFRVDTQVENITLNSTTTNKSLALNIKDADLTLNFQTATTAQAIEDALDAAFNTNITNITIAESDSLVDIAATINAVSSTSGVSANIVQVSANDFRLVIQSNKEGVANGFSIVDGTGVLNEVSFTTVQEAQDALLSINGININRTTNSISDVISGLTFNLLQTTPNFGVASPTIVTANINNDTETVSSAIVNFINSYNAFRVFAEEQTARDDIGEFGEDSVLGQDNTLRSLINQVSAELNSVVGGVTNNFDSLSDIGITLIDFAGDENTPATTNILTYDPTILSTALTNNFDFVRDIFEFQFNASSSNISLFARTNATSLTSFKVDVDINRAVGDQVRILSADGLTTLYNADLTAISGGYNISGKVGTSLEGAVFIYTGDGTDVIDATLSQGITEKLYNNFDGYLKDNGLIDAVVERVTDEDVRLKNEIDTIDRQIDIYRLILLEQFTAMESAITRINSLLNFLDVQSQSIFNS